MTPDNFDKLIEALVEKLAKTLLREQKEEFTRIEKSLDRIENLLRGGAGK